MGNLQLRKRKLNMLFNAVGRQASKLMRTGVAPAAAYGCAVSGLTDESTRTLRSTAAMLLGARPGASITLYLATQPDPFYDPIFDATLPIVIKYASMIWMARDRLGMMERAWMGVEQAVGWEAFLGWIAWADVSRVAELGQSGLDDDELPCDRR